MRADWPGLTVVAAVAGAMTFGAISLGAACQRPGITQYAFDANEAAEGWVEVVVPSTFDAGSGGRP